MAELSETVLPARLPHNLDAERALLGAMILDNKQIGIALEVLPSAAVVQASRPPRRGRAAAEDESLFFSQAHQTIFAAIHAISERSQGLDLTTLADELESRQQLESIGGLVYLTGLEEDILSLGQVPQYARIVADKWRLRCLIRAARQIADDASRGDGAVEEVLDRSEKQIFEISQQHLDHDFVHVGDIVADQLQEIEARIKGGGELPGLSTGFTDLDRLTSGLRPANLIILAARPSMGKTAFAMNIAAYIATRLSRPVGIFSIEMSSSELTQRLLCTLAHVTMGHVRSGNPLRRDELDALHEAAERLGRSPLHIDDASSLSILELRSRARRLKARCPDLSLLVIDYLQLMHSGAARVENRQQEVSEISRSLKALARELQLPVIALSQLSRQTEQRRGAREKLPRLSDLRESGAIEQDADMVIFIHREFLPEGDRNRNEPEIAKVIIGKQRNGPRADFDMLFRGEFTEFVNLSRGEG